VFDLRYHVASLAAVFLALVIGIVVGVGISGSVSSGEKSLEKQRNARLEGQLAATRKAAADLKQRQASAQDFLTEAYPVVMAERLQDKRVAVVYVGPESGRLRALVNRTLSDAGARPVARVRALKVPFDAEALDSSLLTRPAVSQYVGNEQLGALGRAMAQELVKGGDTPLWDTVAGELVDQQFGGLVNPVDGVVVIRSADPQTGPTALFLRGLYSGLAASGVPAVGVEATNAKPTAVRSFGENGLSSVDDLDLAEGRFALALLLQGAEPGRYGVKASASSGILPPVPPVPVGPVSGG
jgi:hypothetical protein